MREHGVGSYGVLITWATGRQVKYWSPTAQQREADYKMHINKPEVKSVIRVKR